MIMRTKLIVEETIKPSEHETISRKSCVVVVVVNVAFASIALQMSSDNGSAQKQQYTERNTTNGGNEQTIKPATKLKRNQIPRKLTTIRIVRECVLGVV